MPLLLVDNFNVYSTRYDNKCRNNRGTIYEDIITESKHSLNHYNFGRLYSHRTYHYPPIIKKLSSRLVSSDHLLIIISWLMQLPKLTCIFNFDHNYKKLIEIYSFKKFCKNETIIDEFTYPDTIVQNFAKCSQKYRNRYSPMICSREQCKR